MNEAAMAPSGVMPSRQPMKDERSSVIQYIGPDRQYDAQADDWTARRSIDSLSMIADAFTLVWLME
jgi:hypothetical protein